MKHCRQEGCFSTPTYGLASSAKKEYCAKHRLDGMVSNKRTQCGGKGCSKTPTFMFAGIRGKRMCPKHVVPGMVPVFRSQCAHDKCIKRPMFGNEESGSRVFCAGHALEGMVNNVDKTCPGRLPKSAIVRCGGHQIESVLLRACCRRNGQPRHKAVCTPWLPQGSLLWGEREQEG